MKKTKLKNRYSEPMPNAGSVRDRILAHLDILTRTAATVGAGLVLTLSTRAQGQEPPQVCDPLPPPIRCCETPEQFISRKCSSLGAEWLKSDDKWILELGISFENKVDFEQLDDKGLKLFGAKLRDMKIRENAAVFQLEAVPGKKDAIIEFSVQCDRQLIPLKVMINLAEEPREDQPVAVKLGVAANPPNK
jgi:hypothetical protein